MSRSKKPRTPANARQEIAAERAEYEPLAAAATVARVVELIDVYCRRLSAERLPAADDLLGEDSVWTVSEPTTSFSFSEVDRLLFAFVDVRVEAKHATDHQVLASQDVGIALVYRLSVDPPPPNIREQLFAGFASVNGVYNAWPYIRESVQSTFARMGLSRVIIPVFRLPRKSQSAPSKDGQGSSE